MILNFEDFINESINEKIKLKALFLCGLPNSGKSTIIKKLSYIPFINIDMDNYIKLFADKQGLDLDLRADAPDIAKKTDIRIKSRDLAVDRMENAINSLLGVVIDGTGRNAELTINQKRIYENWGYDTAMLFVDIDLETALKRNKERDRKVPEQVIIDANHQIKDNIDIYQHNFDNFWKYNSSLDIDSEFKKIESVIRNFFYSPVKNQKGKDILNYLQKNNLKYLSDYDKDAGNVDFFA